MVLMQDDFNKAALFSDSSYNQESTSDSDSAADGVDNLTLEYHDNPFDSLVRKLEYLIQQDPKEAYRMLQMVLDEKLFTEDAQLETLSEKLDTVLDVLRMDTEKDPALESNLTTKNAFTRSVWNLPAPKAPQNNIEPVFKPGFSPNILAA